MTLGSAGAPKTGCKADFGNLRRRRRRQVLDLCFLGVRSAGQPSAVLWLRNPLLALAGLVGYDNRLAMGRRCPRRDHPILAWPLAARAAGTDRAMVVGATAGILRWSLSAALTSLPSIAVLQLLHAFTFGASHLGAMHFLSRAVPPSAAASAQSLYAATSSGLGGGLVMVFAGALYAAYGGGAYLFMAALSAAGLLGSGARPGDERSSEPLAPLRVWFEEGSWHDPFATWSPQPPRRPIIGLRQ